MSELVPDFGDPRIDRGQPWVYEEQNNRVVDRGGGIVMEGDQDDFVGVDKPDMVLSVDCVNALIGVNVKDPDLITKILFACLRCHAEGDIGGLASGIDNLTDIIKKPDGFMTREELISVFEMKLQILEQEKASLMRTSRAIAEDNLRLRAKAENIPSTIEEKKPDDSLLARITEALTNSAKTEQ